jgi:hypothetical protein
MWSSGVKENGRTQVMCIAKLKDGPKRVSKTFSMILERVFEMVRWREKMESHRNEFLKSKCFPPLKILSSLLFEETLRDFLSLPLFFLSFFSLLRLLRGFDDI